MFSSFFIDPDFEPIYATIAKPENFDSEVWALRCTKKVDKHNDEIHAAENPGKVAAIHILLPVSQST
jgi:hypothetical protein